MAAPSPNRKMFSTYSAHAHGIAGFFGASSMERLPVERAITEQVRSFKSLSITNGRSQSWLKSGRRFVTPADVETQVFDWGTIKWLSEPRVTNTERFTIGVVFLHPGKGHVRHNHPGTEEILYVVSGQGKQMIDIDGEKWQAYRAGDLGPHSPGHLPRHDQHRLGAFEVDCNLCAAGARKHYCACCRSCRILPPGALSGAADQ